MREYIWKGEASRIPKLYRPCSCGCDARGGQGGAGYLSGSDDEGYGFTLWIETEEVYQVISRLAPHSTIELN